MTKARYYQFTDKGARLHRLSFPFDWEGKPLSPSGYKQFYVVPEEEVEHAIQELEAEGLIEEVDG